MSTTYFGNETIQIAIARFWPNVDRILQVTGASRREVDATMAHLNAICGLPHDVHTCRIHRPGSPACHAEHMCRCALCSEAFSRVPVKVPVDETTAGLRAAHARFSRGLRDGRTVEGERAYQRTRKMRRAASECAAAATRSTR